MTAPKLTLYRCVKPSCARSFNEAVFACPTCGSDCFEEKSTEPKFQLRFVDIRDARYLRLEDVGAFIRELGGGEETDVRQRLDQAAKNLLDRMRK